MRVRNYLWMQTGDPELAEDLTQDVFVLAFRDRDQLRRPERLASWIMSIARHAALGHMRRARRTIPLASDEGTEMPIEDDAEEAPVTLQRERSMNLLRSYLSALRDKERDIIVMTYFLDMKQREIAESLEISLGSIGTTLNRALRKLQDALEQDGLTMEDLL